MVANITKGNDFAGVVNYAMQETKDARLSDAKNVLTYDKQSIINSFCLQQQMRPDVGKCVGHISLNFSVENKDRVDDELMRQVAHDYMRKMGIVNTQYILVRHYDREHPHCHLIFNRVNNDGKLISDNNDLVRNVRACRAITEQYGLFIAKGKKNVKRHRLKEPDATKYHIYDTMMAVLPMCKSWDELLKALRDKGIHVDFIHRGATDKIQGLVFEMNGLRYRGSKVDRQLSYSKITATLNHNAKVERKRILREREDAKPQFTYNPNTDKYRGRIGTMEERTRPTRTMLPKEYSYEDMVSEQAEKTSAETSENGSSILTGIATAIDVATTPTESCGGGGSSKSDDLDDDEYIDANGVRRKKRRGMHR